MTLSLLRDLRRRGVSLKVDAEAGQLVLDGPAVAVTNADLAALRGCKAEAIELLMRADDAEATALDLIDRLAASAALTPAATNVLDGYRAAIRDCRSNLDPELFNAADAVRLLASRWGDESIGVART